jgi:predicted RNA-binding protein with RPS1 domain
LREQAVTDSQPTNDSQTPETQTPETQTPENQTPETEQSGERRILIGSQRDPGTRKPKRDWKGLPQNVTDKGSPPEEKSDASVDKPTEQATPKTPTAVSFEEAAAEMEADVKPAPAGHIPAPSVRESLSPDLQDELDDAFADMSLEDLISGSSDELSKQEMLEEDTRCKGRVVAVHGDDVFVELGSREQGVASLKLFPEEPTTGAELEVIVLRFNKDDGLYELGIPNAAANVSDWSDLHEGMLVDARITGHNTGGLECEVNHIPGFIPVSQISLFRVEDLAQFVDEKFTCLVTEANPQRGNLVLSHRAILEREREEERTKLMESLAVGQIHDGVVRKIMDFGAFVDIGGVDGLLHISQLAWHRVEHPSEVLKEGQTIKVKVEKIDKASGKIGFGYREMFPSPWDDAADKYPVNSVVQGIVRKLMEFGAFVEVEPGVEGLVHISELSHKRLWRASDVVHEGDKIDVLVQSVDTDAQRMSLSMKATLPEPETKKKTEDTEIAELPAESTKKKSNKPSKPLKGGIGNSTGGEQFGLKW